MTASELYKAGRLQDAIDAQLQEVKKAPADHGKRLFLFEMLALTGDLDRAARQISVVRYDDAEIDLAVAFYTQLLEAEKARRQVFRDGHQPKFLIDPPDTVKVRLEALGRIREGNHTEANRLLEQANAGPAVAGRLNDKPFESMRDCDDLFGPVLEVMAHGDYYWLALEQVDAIVMNAPKFPRDLIWVPARLEVRDGPAGDVFVPALYPFSHEHVDDQIKLGRATDWKQESGGPILGVGQRTWLVDEEASSLLEWRSLEVAN